jgi:hypothetical protein
MELGPMILHSRISDLRKKGHNVEGRHVPGKTGAEGYEYRLVPDFHIFHPSGHTDNDFSVARESLSSVEFIDVRRAVSPPPEAAAPPAEQLTLDGTPLLVPVGPDYYDL